MSLLVFAGGSQFAALAVVSGGGSAIAAVLSGLVLNSRYLAFGMTLAPRLSAPGAQRADAVGERPSHPRLMRAAGSHLLIDESFALAVAEPDPQHSRAAFLCSGLVLFALWNAGTAVGALAGSVLGDPRTLGLDAAMPAALLVLLWPLLRDRQTVMAALLGAGLALVAVPMAPPGVPVLCAALGAFLAMLWPERVREAER